MQAATATSGLMLPIAALCRMMPMFLWLGPGGDIRAMGPTLAKLFAAGSLVGEAFERHFSITRASRTGAMVDWGVLSGQRVHLALRGRRGTVLRGHAFSLGDGGAEGVLLNLSFGSGIALAVREHALTDADFAPTDLAMELLYLQEAKAAVMNELRALNQRLEAAHREAELRARTDPLTGLANRRALDQELALAAQKAALGGPAFALAHMDLDHFKALNDSLGHGAGDFALVRVGKILREETRRRDVVARVGGDEFVLLLREIVDPARLQLLAERIIARIEAPSRFEGAEFRHSASLGVVVSSSYDLIDPDRMQADADMALYAAKRQGRAHCKIMGLDVAPPQEKRQRQSN
jgi:diguanylate cyclase (GGDEF)-like protein